MMHVLHHGRPASNVGCLTPSGAPLWDARAARQEAWADAERAVAEYAPAARKFLFACAEQAQAVRSSASLDRLEEHYLGVPATTGTFPKRQRFWRFVAMIGERE